MSTPSKKLPMNFKTMAQADVPQGRNGKHKQIVTQILSDLDQVKEGSALKVPLAQLAESKEKVRSALNRATRKAGLRVATATDTNFLYVWNEIEQSARSTQVAADRYTQRLLCSLKLTNFPNPSALLYTEKFERASPTLDRASALRRPARPGPRHQHRRKSGRGFR